MGPGDILGEFLEDTPSEIPDAFLDTDDDDGHGGYAPASFDDVTYGYGDLYEPGRRARADMTAEIRMHESTFGGSPPQRQSAPATASASSSPPQPARQRDRHLVGQMPSSVLRGGAVSLVVFVSLDAPARHLASSAPMRAWSIDRQSVITVVAQASRGLTPVTDGECELAVPVDGDSDPVRFAFRAVGEGLQRVDVSARVGGTFLARLAMEISVGTSASVGFTRQHSSRMHDVRATPGEVTLLVLPDRIGYRFQLLSDPRKFEPVYVESFGEGPDATVERVVDTLRGMAAGRSRFAGPAAGWWLKEAGIGLWRAMVPDAVKEQFWQLHAHIAAFNIATTHDGIPWELLYPFASDREEGFLVEQFPVVRQVLGPARPRQLSVSDARYVLASNPPANATAEIAALQRLLGTGEVVSRLDTLLDLIHSGRIGALHFACHNAFDANGAGSAIAIDGGLFVPMLLNSAAVRHTLAARSPLVFINACRSSGAVVEYTRMMSWARQFMEAGAGAFVGTLWAVGSHAARIFAEAFYAALTSGHPLGEASRLARVEASRSDSDPTWLAYSIYGDPQAKIN